MLFMKSLRFLLTDDFFAVSILLSNISSLNVQVWKVKHNMCLQCCRHSRNRQLSWLVYFWDIYLGTREDWDI